MDKTLFFAHPSYKNKCDFLVTSETSGASLLLSGVCVWEGVGVGGGFWGCVCVYVCVSVFLPLLPVIFFFEY